MLDDIKNHHRHSGGNTGIGYIERREMKIARMEIQEIDHFAMNHAVDHIADRSAENKNQTGESQSAMVLRLVENNQNRNDGDAGDANEYQRLGFDIVTRKQAERHAGIANMSDAENFVNHPKGMMPRNM